MNRTDRLLAIVLELQRHGKRRAEDLATTFETSKRTIYRDLEALAESGVPIVSVPGQGYSLVEGYFLPPLSFNADEATMLVLGADVMAQNFDAQYRAAALSASAKIEGVLSDRLREDVRALEVSLRFVASSTPGDPDVPERLYLLRRAIIERRRVRFRYHARFADESRSVTFREADAYVLVFMERNWQLAAFDHRHGDVRNFRLDRMQDLSLLAQTFARPSREQLLNIQSLNRQERTVVVRALFDKSIARWVREQRSYFAVSEEDTADGLLVTLTVRHDDEILQWLLGWGSKVRVLEPESLRQRMADEAKSLLHNHTSLLT